MAEPFTPLTVDGTLPNGEALLEQCAGLVCLYWGDQLGLQSLLNLCGGGEILYFFFDPDNPIPCIAFARQGTHYYVWVAGTVNVDQWIGNVAGCLTPRPYADGILVHSFFWLLAQQLLVGGDSHLPASAPGIRFTVTGHSLGGAVAQILCIELGNRYGVDNVELLTFGQPKCFTAGLSGGDLWPTYIRVRVPNDPVPMVPPDQVLSFFLSSLVPSATQSVAFEWLHYGTGYQLGSGPTLTPDIGLAYWQTVPGQWLLTCDPSAHLIKNIAALLGASEES